jgi:hypothetical protein
VLLAWRRKPVDKFLIVWFVVVYFVFTAIGNRNWRYVMPLFPVLAISASTAVWFGYDKMKAFWQKTNASGRSKIFAKVAACVLVVFAASAVFVSCSDAYYYVSRDQVRVPIEEAVNYVAVKIQPNESFMLLCPFDFCSGGMVNFYLQTNNKQNLVQSYPVLPADTYTPIFNMDELISRCEGSNVKYVLLSEYRWTFTYFNTTLTPQGVAALVYGSGRFLNETSVGTEPNLIFILTFA